MFMLLIAEEVPATSNSVPLIGELLSEGSSFCSILDFFITPNLCTDGDCKVRHSKMISTFFEPWILQGSQCLSLVS